MMNGAGHFHELLSHTRPAGVGVRQLLVALDDISCLDFCHSTLNGFQQGIVDENILVLFAYKDSDITNKIYLTSLS